MTAIALAKPGMEEGATCNREGCDGVIALQKSENCSCHISAPCSSCTSVNLHCPECDWEVEVRAVVQGTFGGRFEYFGGGKFKYIAYTD